MVGQCIRTPGHFHIAIWEARCRKIVAPVFVFDSLGANLRVAKRQSYACARATLLEITGDARGELPAFLEGVTTTQACTSHVGRDASSCKPQLSHPFSSTCSSRLVQSRPARACKSRRNRLSSCHMCDALLTGVPILRNDGCHARRDGLLCRNVCIHTRSDPRCEEKNRNSS